MWGDVFTNKILTFFVNYFNFILLHLNFSCYYCPIKRQPEYSGLRPDTTSLFVFSLHCNLEIMDVTYISVLISVKSQVRLSRKKQRHGEKDDVSFEKRTICWDRAGRSFINYSKSWTVNLVIDPKNYKCRLSKILPHYHIINNSLINGFRGRIFQRYTTLHMCTHKFKKVTQETTN